MRKAAKKPNRPKKRVVAKRKPTRARARAIDADRAKQLAIEYCLFHYPTLYTGGVPRRLSPPAEDCWQVPVKLEDSEAGISADVGEVRLDARTGKVIAATPPPAIVAGGEKRYQELQNARTTAPTPAAKR
jgi:hypothetical protein